jgi:hypothetical protein
VDDEGATASLSRRVSIGSDFSDLPSFTSWLVAAPVEDDQSPLALSSPQDVTSRNSVDSAAITARESVLSIGTYFSNLYTTVDTPPRGEFQKGEGMPSSPSPPSPPPRAQRRGEQRGAAAGRGKRPPSLFFFEGGGDEADDGKGTLLWAF